MNLPSKMLVVTNLESLGRGILVDLRAIDRKYWSGVTIHAFGSGIRTNVSLYYLSISPNALGAYQCNFTSDLQMHRVQPLPQTIPMISSGHGPQTMARFGILPAT